MLISGNAHKVKQELARYQEHGITNMRKVLEIPLNERIPALLKHPDNYEPIYTALVASLRSAIANINVRVGMNEDQVLELAQMILDGAHEDNLGLEDVLLFLGELLTGKAGKIYDRLDIPTFFDLFENYRQRRHVMMKSHQDEIDAQYRAVPVNDRFIYEDLLSDRKACRNAMQAYLLNKPKEEQ